MTFAAFASLMFLLIGFGLGISLASWADAERARTPITRVPATTVLERFRVQAQELAERAVLAGGQVALGAPFAPTGIERQLEKGAREIHLTTNAITALAGAAFMQGATGVRRALGERSGIDDGVLDEAVAAALEEVGS